MSSIVNIYVPQSRNVELNISFKLKLKKNDPTINKNKTFQQKSDLNIKQSHNIRVFGISQPLDCESSMIPPSINR